MKAAPFQYVRVESVQEAAVLLAERDARLLAGGQSLMPALALREQTTGKLVDITGLRELRGVEIDEQQVVVGAAEPLRTLELSGSFAAAVPLLAQAIRTVAAMAIRSRCTLGGSIAWADPTSQLPATLLACDADVITSQRTVTLEQLYATSGSPLAPDEVILQVRIPTHAQARFGLRHVRRTHITWPVAGAAALVDHRGVRLGLYGAGPRPVLITASTAQDALAQLPSRLDPPSDERAGSRYRRRVLPVLARRALEQTEGDGDTTGDIERTNR